MIEHDLASDDYVYNENFDIKYYLDTFIENDRLNINEFDSDKWKLENQREAIFYHIHFNKIKEVSWEHSDPFETIVKCWIVASVEKELSESTVSARANKLIEFIQVTDGIEIEKINDYLEFLDLQKEGYQVTASAAIRDFLEFNSFINTANLELLIKQLALISKKNYKNRALPTIDDIKIFHSVVTEYAGKVEFGSEQYLRYFPIFLWWELTTIIPLRICEFCSISRDALIIEKEGFYLKLPREKQKANPNRIQVIDIIKIPESLGNKVDEYIKFTDKFGYTETLISYKGTAEHRSVKYWKAYEKKINKYRYSSNIFRVALKNFYYYIVQKNYSIAIMEGDFENYAPLKPSDFEKNLATMQKLIRPGDTRHFAIMNLMRQGYTSIEISRLAGHTSLNSKNPYLQHNDLYNDFETIRIGDFLRGLGHDYGNSGFGELGGFNRILINNVQENINIDNAEKLNVGFCIDKEKRCPAEYRNIHLHCPYWRITLQEFEEKKDLIDKELSKMNNSIQVKINLLNDLHKVALQTYFQNEDYQEDNVVYRSELNNANVKLTNEIRVLDSIVSKIIINKDEKIEE